MMMKTDEAKIKNSPLYPFFLFELLLLCYCVSPLHYTTCDSNNDLHYNR